MAQPNFMFAEKMGMVLYNPTDEDLDMQYSGVSFTMKSGEKGTFDSNAANHLLNSYGPRGLSYLQYEADERKVREDGKARNIAFKRRMVTDFNMRNENRKVQGLQYLVPTKILKDYANQLGLTLMEPYAARDEEKAKIADQSQIIIQLQSTVQALMNKIDAMTKPDSELEKPRQKPYTLKKGMDAESTV